MATSLNDRTWLDWMTTLMGGVSRQNSASTFPPDRFYCLMDELPLHLIPQYALRSLRRRSDNAQALVLNPDCTLCSGEELPDEIAHHKELVSRFALQGTIAWVRDSATAFMRPFWLGPEFSSIVRGMRPGEAAGRNLRNDVRALLAGAGILVEDDHAAVSYQTLQSVIAKSAPVFQTKGYAPLVSLIHPFHVAALRRYYRYLIRTGAIALGDEQSARRYVAYNEPVARFFHHSLASVLSMLAGEPLKPSYVYVASYKSGAELKKHTDREQCDFSITLCLDFSPEPVFETPWPIRLETPDGTVSVYQALGDGLAYRGTQLPHYRGALREGRTSTSIFFHYVKSDFSGPLD